MADKIFHSAAVTFVDMTDSRILDVYISSNHPTVQLCNVNKTPLEYTPDWSKADSKLELTASFYLDSSEIAPETVEWYTKIGTIETIVGNETTLYVTSNVLENNAIITYGCRVTYQNLEAFKEISFTRVDTGLNGTNGTSAPAVQAQYSADGLTGWTATLNAATHKYIRYSYDGGKTWTTSIKIVGEDGTSVNIKGTATSKTAVSGTSYYTLVYNSTTITGAAIGDAYLLEGNLYVCVDSRDGNDYFMDVGHIQGPQGNDGQSSYVFIRYATDASGSSMVASPNSTTTHIGICTVNTNVAPTTANSYTWSKFVGDNAKSLILNGDSQVFKVDKDKAYTPGTIKVTAQRINIPTTASLTWYYNGSTTMPSKGVAKNGDIVTITGSDLATDYLTIKVSDGVVEDVFTVYKAFDGYDGSKGDDGQPASMAFLTNENVSFSANASGIVTATPITTNVVAYSGTTKQMPTIGEILGVPSGMTITTRQDTLLNEVELTVSFATDANLGSSASTSGTITIPVISPVVTNLKLSWSKINTGAKGDQGDKGGDAYTVMLTNESYTFAGDIDHAYASDIATQIIGYKGSEQQSVTIKSVNGKTAAIIDTDTGITGLKFKCSKLSDTLPTITFTCTEDFEEPSGAIPIVVSINNVEFTRMFNYSIAFKGATGETGGKGDPGAPATAYWLVSSASVVQKTSTGTIAVTPSTLTFTGKSKTGTSAPTDYGCRWIIAYSTDGSTYTNLYTSTANETTKTITVATTYKTIRVRMYLAGGTTTLLDEQIIPIVSDGAKGDIGNTGRGVSSIVEQYYKSTSATSQTEGSWSTTVPTWEDGKYIWTRSVITYTDSTTSTTSPVCVTGQKGGIGGTGVGVSSVDVWYYQSTSATALSGGSWSTTSPTWSNEKYVWTKTIITYTNNTTDETAAVCITGQKGSTGVGIKSVTEYYLATSSSSGITTSTTGWTTAIQTITVDKKYLWNYEIITYTDNTTSTTAPIVIGTFGDTGKGIKSVTEYYLATTSSSGVTTATTGWTTTMQALTATNKYLWNYELITYTDNTTATINPVIIGVYGDKGNQGNPGVGISSVTVTYGTSTSASTQPTSWQTTIPTVAEGSYLWTRTITDYTDNSVADTVTYTYAKQGKTPIKGTDYMDGTSVTVSSIQYQASTSATTAPTSTWSDSVVTVAEGSYLWTKTTFSDGKVAYGVAKQGKSGTDAHTVILTNESHVFAGNVSSAIASSATTQILAYKGGTAQSVTIVSVDGKTASTSSTATSIAGLSFVCSALSGTSPTITFTCTTSFVSPSGAIPIVLTVNGVTITKIFTYGIAFKGTIGTPASLVDITPSAHYFKSTTGKDGTFTPDYIYLYPRFQTVTYSKWEYSINGGTSWTTVTSGSNGLTIGTYNSVANSLQIAKTSALYTDSVTSISFRCVSSTASVNDTVSIAKIYDVVDLQIGGRNLLKWTKDLPITSKNNGVDGISTYNGANGKLTSTNDGLKLTFDGTSNSCISVPLIYDGVINNNEIMTLSFDYRGNITSIGNFYFLQRTSPNVSYNLSQKTALVANETAWQHCEVTFSMANANERTNYQILLFYGLSQYTADNWIEIKSESLKLEKGNKATAWTPAIEDSTSITFQIYAPEGYVLSNKLESLTLQTFAYEGSAGITSATYAWSYQENDEWITIADATTNSLTVIKEDVIKTKTYRCEMTYKGKTYYATTTVQDISDVYEALICVSDNVNPLTGIYYWVVYALLYSEQGEADALLGPISIDAPASPASGDYWYAVDGATQTVTLKKYNGSAWVVSTDKQAYEYDWSHIVNGSQHYAIGNTDKVQIISCNSFTSNATFQCVVTGTDGDKLARCNVHLTDTSDPIVSSTAPTGVKDGQLWMQTQTDGTFLLHIWNADTSTWKQLNADTKNVVHTKKPSSYKTGDLWVVESDTAITGYIKGTLLQATATSTTFASAHWTPSLKYEAEIADLQKTLKSYKQYMSVDTDGLHMRAKDADGTLSPFQALFTNTRLSFWQDDLEVAYISDNKLNIYEANIDVLSVEKKIQLQKFEWAIESNGSMSLIVNY